MVTARLIVSCIPLVLGKSEKQMIKNGDYFRVIRGDSEPDRSDFLIFLALLL